MKETFLKINVDDALAMGRVRIKEGQKVSIQKIGSKIEIEWEASSKEAKKP